MFDAETATFLKSVTNKSNYHNPKRLAELLYNYGYRASDGSILSNQQVRTKLHQGDDWIALEKVEGPGSSLYRFLFLPWPLSILSLAMDTYPSEKFKKDHPNNHFEQKPYDLALQEQQDQKSGESVGINSPDIGPAVDNDMGETGDPTLGGFIVPDGQEKVEAMDKAAEASLSEVRELNEADFDTTHFWIPVTWDRFILFTCFKLPWITVTYQVRSPFLPSL